MSEVVTGFTIRMGADDTEGSFEETEQDVAEFMVGNMSMGETWLIKKIKAKKVEDPEGNYNYLAEEIKD